jgi:sugar lactone lactonase YvrE
MAPPAGNGPSASPVDANSDGTVSTVTGDGTGGFSGDGGGAKAARINAPMDVTIADDVLLIADAMNGRVRAVDLATGRISTVAAGLNMPVGVTPNPEGGFYVADWAEHRVYAFAGDGSRTTLLGTGDGGCQDIGVEPTATNINSPRDTAVMIDGSVLVSEQGCHRIRRLTLSGALEEYAGVGSPGYEGDGAPAVDALLNAGSLNDGPAFGLSLSPEEPPDELFLADTENHVIRQVKVFTGRMETFAGSGVAGFQDGTPDEAQFNRPTHVFADRDHALWVVDAGNHAIRYIDPLGTRVTTVVGTGSPGFNGDRLPPRETQLRSPTAVWVDNAGRVFIADAGNHRVRLYASR